MFDIDLTYDVYVNTNSGAILMAESLGCLTSDDDNEAADFIGQNVNLEEYVTYGFEGGRIFMIYPIGPENPVLNFWRAGERKIGRGCRGPKIKGAVFNEVEADQGGSPDLKEHAVASASRSGGTHGGFTVRVTLNGESESQVHEFAKKVYQINTAWAKGKIEIIGNDPCFQN